MYEAHHTFGHIYYAAIKHVMKSEMVIGLDVCAKAKLHRKPFPNEASNQSTTFSKHIFADLWGLATVLSISSAWYSVDFTDNCFHWSEIEFLNTKDQAQDAYKRLDTQLKTQDGVCIKYFHMDRGKELFNKRFNKYLVKHGTICELTMHDTHKQVRVAERLNQTKLELTHAMLVDLGLPWFLGLKPSDICSGSKTACWQMP